MHNFNNNPKNILSTWIAFEALSPQTFAKPEELANNDRSCIATLNENDLPWQHNEVSRKDRQLYYLVILGSIPLKLATEQLVKVFGQDEEFNLQEKSNAILAAVLLDRKGCLLKEKAIGISSFGWAFPKALNKELKDLASWAEVEEKTLKSLEEILNKVDNEGNSIPLTSKSIDEAYLWLVNHFNLSSDFVEKPKHIIRIYHYYKSKTPPEVPLLNSFFLNDLSLVSNQLKQNNLPKGLNYYLGVNKHTTSKDILRNKANLEDSLAPHKMNLARWPATGGHPLVTLQQAAVNVSREQLTSDSGIVAVNGPPGTGKTTLLRDIIASVVSDRAMAMCQFDDPDKAFIATGKKKSAGQGFFHLYKLDDSLKGYEIVVASSNNKAVENISKELPASKAIDDNYTKKINYFKTVSDELFSGNNKANSNEKNEGNDEPLNTWGLITAVLGNSANRYAFQQAFWWNNENSFQVYLKAAKGDNPIIEEPDKDGEKIRRRPNIITQENPPTSKAVALNEWKQAKTKFVQLKNEVESQLQALSLVREQWHLLSKTKQQIKETEELINVTKEQHQQLNPSLDFCQEIIKQYEHQKEELNSELLYHQKLKPNFFVKLLRLQSWRTWIAHWSHLSDQKRQLSNELQENKAKRDSILTKQQKIQAEINNHKQQLAALSIKQQQLENDLSLAKKNYGKRIVNDHYLFAEHEILHKNSPWIPDELHRKREELFIAALMVQRAFIGAAAQKYQHNLSFLIDAMNNGLSEDHKEYLPDIWSTLFSVIPVVSTTFASVETMFGKLPKESIGWLLIDEAGQALPQAAVGSIFRAKRSLVVGDPLQIPPVVSLPKELITKISQYFSVDETIWGAPIASTQTLADTASLYQSKLENTDESPTVGLPLLVHRRCQNPMFTISNSVAYNNQMVHAVSQKPLDQVATLLGKSCWFSIDGEADSKWCLAEGKLALKLLTCIINNVDNPDVFIITPFRDVAYHLKNLLRKEETLFRKLSLKDEQEWIKWLNNNIGTVHTFQGREAETVIFVLGAPNSNQNGVRKWAAETPNIINVAVSRAKNNLYVIGSHTLWSGVGFAREMANRLPIQCDLDYINQSVSEVLPSSEESDCDSYQPINDNIEDYYKDEVPLQESYYNADDRDDNYFFDHDETDKSSLETPTKTCSKCNQLLSKDHFFITNKHDDGLSKWCKSCLKPQNKAPAGYKVCPKCLKNRKKSSFYNSKKHSDGLSKWCKYCLDDYKSTRA